ncbi:AAA family ATPase [Dethiosulfovibrio salsuginis]|uniref:ATPase AAA-type core domain-containing protein n=1 Tax=Dethiosulfovibrio salsuginis TaxID=561720 RepID=A0A1X7K1X0_9BACT|nr:ATP-binding protein [Dethiosulfovibrio salsuginis]SMG34884.1 hypothetical protein SAMN06275492_1204 [Dethiosulfovibrio salsuginis]
MLIRFSIENWMSFRDKVDFSMIASKERQHGERVPKLDKHRTRALPIAALYGGNASGKTNFFKALSFVKTLVVNGTRPDSLIPVDFFKLSLEGSKQPSRFEFEVLIDETIYDFRLAVTRNAILEESLTAISSSSEKVLYSRREGDIDLDKSLPDRDFFLFAFKGTRINQLFLTNSVDQNIDAFRPVYDWFKDILQLIAPDSRFEPFERFFDDGHPLYNSMNDMLCQLDTGILHLGSEDVPLDNVPIPESFKMMLKEDVKEGMAVRLPTKERLVITRENDELIAKKLISFHSREDGTSVKFDIRQESDGSQRVIDLLPAFLELAADGSKKVYIIDEIDRSLHPLLTRRLIEFYLSACSDRSRSQLLFTTHDMLLMDQELFRRDEMWVAERDLHGASSLFSFSDYKDIRYDKDILKSYLQGRFGGIPRLLTRGSCF